MSLSISADSTRHRSPRSPRTATSTTPPWPGWASGWPGFDGVKSLVVLGHAGEGTFLTQDEQVALVRNLVNEVSVPDHRRDHR